MPLSPFSNFRIKIAHKLDATQQLVSWPDKVSLRPRLRLELEGDGQLVASSWSLEPAAPLSRRATSCGRESESELITSFKEIELRERVESK